MTELPKPDRRIAAAFEKWRLDPVKMVRDLFGVDPDAWQAEVLMEFARGNQRIAMAACKGPGKSCVLAWIIWNFLLTRPHPKVVCTSITGKNLLDGLWSELAKWLAKSKLLQDMFVWQKTRVFAKQHPETWWCSARTWSASADPQMQADTLAGIHADYVLFVLDEAGGIPDSVMASAEAGLANAAGGGGKEAHLVLAGNPTHLSGPLYRACTTEKRLWWVKHITGDPDAVDRSPRVSAQWAREQIEKYGRDNPWVLVNVFGKFPPSSINALIGPEEVREAMKRFIAPEKLVGLAKILGVDVARMGPDLSVIFKRQGKQAFPPQTMRNVDSITGAGQVARQWSSWGAQACFIDDTGGFGGGWIDQLRALSYQPLGIHFAGKASSPRYANKRAEMWFEMARWIKEGGCLPDVPELVDELSQSTYTFAGDSLLLEDKELLRAKIGRSPDYADALALTFAQPVQAPGAAPFVTGFQSGQTARQRYRAGMDRPVQEDRVQLDRPFVVRDGPAT